MNIPAKRRTVEDLARFINHIIENGQGDSPLTLDTIELAKLPTYVLGGTNTHLVIKTLNGDEYHMNIDSIWDAENMGVSKAK